MPDRKEKKPTTSGLLPGKVNQDLFAQIVQKDEGSPLRQLAGIGSIIQQGRLRSDEAKQMKDNKAREQALMRRINQAGMRYSGPVPSYSGPGPSLGRSGSGLGGNLTLPRVRPPGSSGGVLAPIVAPPRQNPVTIRPPAKKCNVFQKLFGMC